MSQINIDNEKPYYSKKRAWLLKQIITREKYGDFAIILEDIFQRRAYEFGFTYEEIYDQAKNFESNVNEIIFASKKELGIAMGAYVSGKHVIKLNQDYYLSLYRKLGSDTKWGEYLHETLAHEVFHAIGDYRNEKKILGLSYQDEITNSWCGAALDEVFVETAADRICFSRNSKDAERGRRETNGYGSITFATNLLAASLGVTEKELLKVGIQNRKKLNELIRSRFPTIKTGNIAIFDKFNAFETALDSVYNIDYKKKENETPKETTFKKNLLISSLAGLYCSAYELSAFRIQEYTGEINSSFVGEIRHNFVKMERIMNDSINDFKLRYSFSDNEVQEILQSVADLRNDISHKIIGCNIIASQGHKIASEDYKNQVVRAKNGEFFTSQNIKKLQGEYGIELPSEIGIHEVLDSTSELETSNHVFKEDFDNGMQWDNAASSAILERIFRNKMLEKGINIDQSTEITTELPIVNDGSEITTELPIVNDGSEITTELPIVDDKSEITTELPIVDDKSEITTKLSTVAVVSEMTEKLPAVRENGIRWIGISFWDRIKRMAAGIATKIGISRDKTKSLEYDKSGYYAQLALAQLNNDDRTSGDTKMENSPTNNPFDSLYKVGYTPVPGKAEKNVGQAEKTRNIEGKEK